MSVMVSRNRIMFGESGMRVIKYSELSRDLIQKPSLCFYGYSAMRHISATAG